MEPVSSALLSFTSAAWMASLRFFRHLRGAAIPSTRPEQPAAASHPLTLQHLGGIMRTWKLALLPALGVALLGTARLAPAQISVNIGPEPVCPYGYYDYAPYPCAPYGYYGAEWFSGGVFIGAGPWFHGHHDFYGHVNNSFDPHHGYHGPMPNREEHFARPDEQGAAHDFHDFHGNEMRDGRGHAR